MGLFSHNKPLSLPALPKPGGKTDEIIEALDNLKPEEIPPRLSVLAIAGNVIYPGTVVPVYIEDLGAKQALAVAQKEHQGLIATLTLKSEVRKEGKDHKEDSSKPTPPLPPKPSFPKQKEITPSQMFHTGTVSFIHRIVPTSKRPEAGIMVVLQGMAKVRVLEFISENKNYWEAILEGLSDFIPQNQNVEALAKTALTSAQKIISQTPYLPQELQIALESLDDPLKLTYMIATLTRIKVEEKQRLLELSSAEAKLTELVKILQKELEMMEIGGRIADQVKKDFSKFQRDAYLREQLKAIKHELGEDQSEGEKEAKSYQKKLARVKLPPEAKKEVEREIKRLSEMHPASLEYQSVRTYLDLCLDLPWNKQTVEKIDLGAAQKQLDKDHYDLKEAKERILEYLAVRKIKKNSKGPILCFVGPPGVGKTSLGQSIARALGKKFVRMSLGGMRDEAEIRGHRRTYVGALPGRILQSVRRAQSKNPVFMLDEIDKVGVDFRGDPASALLEVLDPEQNKAFRDHYIDLDFDLSQVFFIATANFLDPVQPALRDRMEVIHLPGYTDQEKLHIAKKYLVPKTKLENGLKSNQIRISDMAILKIISQYTKEAGVRNLERELAKICRKAVRQVVASSPSKPSLPSFKKLVVTDKNLEDFLGPQKVFPEVARRVSRPGVATALGVTLAGGEIMFIEATKMPGRRGFLLTGKLGDVMKESAQAALSLIRSRASELKIDERFFDKFDLHLHVPEGATPKDGPSAGVAMVAALASLMSNRAVRSNVAMTGEITLSGLVLPIGGVKEKVLAAKRAGIENVILPKKNQGEIKEIEPELKNGLQFLYVETVDEVLKNALEQGTAQAKDGARGEDRTPGLGLMSPSL